MSEENNKKDIVEQTTGKENFIEALTAFSYLSLSKESIEMLDKLTSNKDDGDDDWKATALEIMRKVDVRQKEEAEAKKKVALESINATEESPKEKNANTAKWSINELLSDEVLHNATVLCFEKEERALEEEMKNSKPHVFSEEFERKMEEVMRVQPRLIKPRKVVYYITSAAAVILVAFGLLFVKNEDLHASKFRIDVLEWMEEFFVVENNADEDKDDMTDVLFEESQIGYIPEGFEKVEEEIAFSKVCYRYQSQTGEYFSVSVYKNKTFAGVDNKEVGQDIRVNEAGLEYHYVYRTDSAKHILTWTDKSQKFYVLAGTIAEEDIVQFMNGISY